MNNTAIFAGGCFWCVEHDLRALSGVIEVTSGYSGPTSPRDGASRDKRPTYEDHEGYREAVQVTYDTEKISFKIKNCASSSSTILIRLMPADSFMIVGNHIKRQSIIKMMARNQLPKRFYKNWTKAEFLRRKKSPSKSFQKRNFTKPRNIIRITPTKILIITNNIRKDLVGYNLWPIPVP